MGDWGLLGWLETAIKWAALSLGIGALVGTLGDRADGPSGARLAQVVILAVLTAGLVAGIADRLIDREIVGIVFVPAMAAGHLCMAVALARAEIDEALVVFCALMLAGEAVKLAFLATSGFRVRALPPAAVYGLTWAYAAGYAAVLALQAV